MAVERSKPAGERVKERHVAVFTAELGGEWKASLLCHIPYQMLTLLWDWLLILQGLDLAELSSQVFLQHLNPAMDHGAQLTAHPDHIQ